MILQVKQIWAWSTFGGEMWVIQWMMLGFCLWHSAEVMDLMALLWSDNL